MTEHTPLFTLPPQAHWAYAEHLVQLSSIKSVLLDKDLCDSSGNRVLAKGSQLSLHNLASIKDLMPETGLEPWVNIESSITQTGLSSRFAQLLHQHPDLQAIFDANELEYPLQTCLKDFTRYRFFIQKMNLLEILLPDLFHKACYCTLLCLATARQLALPYAHTQTLFITSMLRDIGVLHLEEPSKVNIQSSSDDEIKTKDILKRSAWVLGLEPAAATDEALLGLLEQYERADGSGFPTGDMGETLSDLGQLLALTNKIYDTYWNYLEPKGLGLRACIPMLRLNNIRYKYKHYAAMSRAISCSDLAETRHVANQFMGHFTTTLLQTQQQLERWYTLTQSLSEQLPSKLSDKSDHPTLSRLKRMMSSVRNRVEISGIFSECMGRWIEYVQLTELEVSYLEMEEIHLMLHEISDQLHEISAQIDQSICALASKTNTPAPPATKKSSKPDQIKRFHALQGQLLNLVKSA